MRLNEFRDAFNIPPAKFELDSGRLPVFITAYLDALGDIMPETQRDSLLLDILVKIAQTLSVRRVRFKTESGEEVPANIYGIIFMGSGEGKDRPLFEINNSVLKDIYTEFVQLREKYRKEREEENYKFAEVNFDHKAARSKYITENRPRLLPYEISDATIEGFVQTREEFQRAGFGGTFIKIGEFADYILTRNDRHEEMLSLLKEVYDYGNSQVKAIKGERQTQEVNGVPSNALFHSSISGLQTDEGREKLLRYLDRGLARRSFICYPDAEDLGLTVDNYEVWLAGYASKASAAYIKLQTDAREYANYVMEALVDNSCFVLCPEAKALVDRYKWFSRILELPDYVPPAIVAEMKGRNWKMEKLAVVIAAWEHPESQIVTREDVERAIYLTEYFGQHFEKLIDNPMVGPVEHLFGFLQRFVGQWVPTMDIRSAGIVPAKDFGHWFREVYGDLEMLANSKAYDLLVDRVGKNGRKFMLKKQELTDPSKLQISTSSDITQGFVMQTVNLEKVAAIANSAINYSPSVFRDGYRKKDNYLGGNNLIVLDIDEGWSLTEAQDFLTSKKLVAVITTTKSHQIVKNGKICDRFRIFLPVLTPINLNPEQFSLLMKNVMAFFLGKPDPACKDVSRFFWGNVSGKTFPVNGELLFDWRPFVEAPEVKAPALVGNFEKSPFPSEFGAPDLHALLGSEELLRRLGFYEDAREGNRNNFLARITMWMRDEGSCSLGEVEQEVRSINSRMSPPLPERELSIIFKAHLK